MNQTRIEILLKKICRTVFLYLILVCSSSFATVPSIIGVIRCDTVQTLFGYQIVPLGDQNNDGYADFLIWDYRKIGFVCYGGNPLPTLPARRIHDMNGFISNVGDVSGDGINDLTCRQFKFSLFLGGNGLDTIPYSVFGLDTLVPAGYSVSTKDIGCSGEMKILSQCLDHYSVLQFNVSEPPDSTPSGILRPWWFPYPGYTFGRSLTAGDFNGDGKRDIAISLLLDEQYGMKSQVCIYYGGCGFDTIPDLLFSQAGPFDYTKIQFGMIIQNIGHFNGDSYDDLFVGHWESQDSTGLIYFGGLGFDSIPDLIITDTPTRAKRGYDLNGDGYDDLITSYPLQSSSFSYVDIFYGGTKVDSIPDLRINVWEMPEYLILFGMDIAGLGDVNGDGINDFAVSAVDGGGHGVVYIFSGNKSGMDVEIEQDKNLPKDFILNPNYPNPFNGSTTISFELPRRGRVKVEIFDISGKQIVNLLNCEFSAGRHRVTWDGEFAENKPATSGIYFCRVEFGDQNLTQKLILLK
jgi:hypothetical protein